MKDPMVLERAIETKIFMTRGHKIMLDKHLAELYRVSTKRLNEQVKRNIRRFPNDFMFQLNLEEAYSLRSQFATLKNMKGDFSKRGKHIKYLPYAFTEQGVAMLSGILNSKRAIDVNIAIMRAFIKLRHLLLMNKELAYKLVALENKIEKHDTEIQGIFEAIRQLMVPSKPKPKPQIGFKPDPKWNK